jgi:hypothetical protein
VLVQRQRKGGEGEGRERSNNNNIINNTTTIEKGGEGKQRETKREEKGRGTILSNMNRLVGGTLGRLAMDKAF